MAQAKLNAGQTDKTAQYLNNIELELKQMANTLTNLLSYSRPDNIQTENECISEIIKRSIYMFEPEAHKKNIDIHAVFSPDADIFPLETGLLPGVFNNIIKNAIHATDSGHIKIKTILNDNSIIITIKDTGSGIPEKYINDIFRPFFTTKDKTHGTGLGLAISKEIVEKRGGTISANNHPQEGCVFEIRIPVSENY